MYFFTQLWATLLKPIQLDLSHCQQYHRTGIYNTQNIYNHNENKYATLINTHLQYHQIHLQLDIATLRYGNKLLVMNDKYIKPH